MSASFCRFLVSGSISPKIGLVRAGQGIVDLSLGGFNSLTQLLDDAALRQRARAFGEAQSATLPLTGVQLLPPVEQQEVWAAGVTYLRSKKARMDESDFSATAYDKVYEAPRPEIFFKALAHKVVATGDKVGIRSDARWNVPEPELALVINSRGEIAGMTIGNDMSSRDIEGENLLYLPQAKVYDRSCALGPWITTDIDEPTARAWTISVAISRANAEVFQGSTSVGMIKRSFAELVGYLSRSQTFPHGAVLLTGTGVVPDETFTLAENDEVTIQISGIGTLKNRVTVV